MKTINLHHYQDPAIYITAEYETDANGKVTNAKITGGRGNVVQQNNVISRLRFLQNKGIATLETVVQAELAKFAAFEAANAATDQQQAQLAIQTQNDFTAFENATPRQYLGY